MAGIRKRDPSSAGEGHHQKESVTGGGWVRISNERRDGRIQVQYHLFDSRGRIHSQLNGTISAETERRYNNVDEASGLDDGIVSIEFRGDGGWSVYRMVRKVFTQRG